MAPVPTEVARDEPSTSSASDSPKSQRKRAVIVGFGMVGIAFVEKLLKYDIEGGRDEWEVIV